MNLKVSKNSKKVLGKYYRFTLLLLMLAIMLTSSSGTGRQLVNAAPNLFDPEITSSSMSAQGSPHDHQATTKEIISTAEINVSAILQGGARPDPAGWTIPVTVKFFSPGADVLVDPEILRFNVNTVKSNGTAICQCVDVVPGTYDVSVGSEHTLINVMRNVVIAVPYMSLNMGTLLEGDANSDGIVNITDFSILAASFMKMEGEEGFEPGADFDYNGIINISDFGLLAVNFLKSSPIDTGEWHLPNPDFNGVSLELCLNSRYSNHSLTGSASDQQLSNIMWAAGRPPTVGSDITLHVVTPFGTYLYDAVTHSLNWDSAKITDECAFYIEYFPDSDFDSGLGYMPPLLAAIDSWQSGSPSTACCPKTHRMDFGIQEVGELTAELTAVSSVSEGESGWLPNPSTNGNNNLQDVIANLTFSSSFSQTDLTLQQISQILWAGYGCTPHAAYGKIGLTVPSAHAGYYLTGSIYFASQDGVFRYHNRNPDLDLTTSDHRIEQINTSDVRNDILSAVVSLPQAPFYVIICRDNDVIVENERYIDVELGLVPSNMLLQATAMDLGCNVKTFLTTEEQSNIQNDTSIPTTHIPRVIVSIGAVDQ